MQALEPFNEDSNWPNQKISWTVKNNKPNFIRQSRQISTMIDCQKTYDARIARNSSMLKLPNAEWTGPERCIHEHIEFSSCNNQGLSNSLATCTNTNTNDTLNCWEHNKKIQEKFIFSVTRRSRSDSRYSLTHSVIVSTELTDVTLVSDDTYRRLYWYYPDDSDEHDDPDNRWKLSGDESYLVMKVTLWWKLSSDESYLVMKVT